MNEQEVQKHAPPETTSVDGRREVKNPGRRTAERAECQRCLPAARDCGRPWLHLWRGRAASGAPYFLEPFHVDQLELSVKCFFTLLTHLRLAVVGQCPLRLARLQAVQI